MLLLQELEKRRKKTLKLQQEWEEKYRGSLLNRTGVAGSATPAVRGGLCPSGGLPSVSLPPPCGDLESGVTLMQRRVRELYERSVPLTPSRRGSVASAAPATEPQRKELLVPQPQPTPRLGLQSLLTKPKTDQSYSTFEDDLTMCVQASTQTEVEARETGTQYEEPPEDSGDEGSPSTTSTIPVSPSPPVEVMPVPLSPSESQPHGHTVAPPLDVHRGTSSPRRTQF